MSENAASRDGPPESTGGHRSGSPGGSGTDARRGERGRRVAALVQSLPERFRSAGDRLAAELFGEPGSFLEVASDTAGERPPWHSGLELEEAWAVAQAFRRAIQEQDGIVEGPPDPTLLGDLGERIDRSLLEAAVSSLDRTSKAHRRMVQDVSHDLRSPLNSILFLADALRTERSGPLTEAQAHQLDVLYTASATLVRMANDLIDFSRLAAGQERITLVEGSFSLETVVAEVRSLVGPVAAQRGVEVVTRLEAEGLRRGDQRLLSRVLLNLVANAVEASDAGGEVLLECADTEDGRLKIEVGDDAAGDVETLRQLLAITDDRWPGETRGWTRGLGLTISARFVEAAGGWMDVRSREGAGTVFLVTLPFPAL